MVSITVEIVLKMNLAQTSHVSTQIVSSSKFSDGPSYRKLFIFLPMRFTECRPCFPHWSSCSLDPKADEKVLCIQL